MLNVPLVFLDTETTGLSFEKQVWEVAMIRDNPDGTTERDEFMLMTLATDSDLYEFNPTAAVISGFHERWQSDKCIVGSEAVKRIEYMFRDNAHLVGMVPDFDSNALWRMMRDIKPDQYRVRFPWYYQLIDVDIMAYGYYLRHVQDEPIPEKYVPGLTSLPVDSDKLSTLLNVELPTAEERHTAMGDAAWTRRIFYALAGATPPK